ncbi:MAG: NTP transferase domain-containing protein [Planctomycetaceae bacterium]
MASRQAGRVFAIVPAAGLRRRMGQPKLLMDLAGASVIERLLSALAIPSITDRVVVLRPDDSRLAAAVTSAGGSVFRPDVAPPDMKASVVCALDYVQRVHQPTSDDAWLLTPADHPLLERSVVEAVVEAWRVRMPDALIPEYRRQKGHPVVFKWSVSRLLPTIPSDHGLNWLMRAGRMDVQCLAVETPSILQDLDTPEDYRRLQDQTGIDRRLD